jgi:hypothetical protein
MSPYFLQKKVVKNVVKDLIMLKVPSQKNLPIFIGKIP